MKTRRSRPQGHSTKGEATRAIHTGEDKFRIASPVATPIIRSSTFTFSSTEEMKRWAEGRSKEYIYTRYGNPTLTVAEEKIASLEGTESAVVAASGMAAISSALLSVLQAGDEVIATRQLYGGSYRLMRDVLPRFGIIVKHVENDLRGAEALVTENTRALYVETPTNPTLRLVDLAKAAAFARKHKLAALIDNTFATPVLQRPAELGYDIILHSATKYLGGHSDLIAGVAAGSRKYMDGVRHMIIHLGGSMDPDVAFLLIRGIKTLALRVRRQCETALAVARFLEKHPRVERVHYPGLASHPDHRLARRQMSGFGSMMAFDVKGGIAAARRVCDRVRVFLLAVSLGGVESLVALPMFTSHYKMSPAELRSVGVTPGTIRVSIGLEEPADLIADLKQALA